MRILHRQSVRRGEMHSRDGKDGILIHIIVSRCDDLILERMGFRVRLRPCPRLIPPLTLRVPSKSGF